MSEAITRLDELTPVAQFVECWKVTAREFISRDGYRFVGYRATPENAGFLVWERRGDFQHGFADRAVYRCSTEAEACAWVLARLNAASTITEEMRNSPIPAERPLLA